MAEGANTGSAPGREALAVALAGLALVGGLAWWVTRPLAAPSRRELTPLAGAFVGSRACAGCHPGEAAAHARSAHAHTLQPAAQSDAIGELIGRTVDDPERPGVAWSYSRDGDRVVAERREGGRVEREVLEWAFGSGTHAVTFVTLTDPDPTAPRAREHRLTYFRAEGGLDITPGHQKEDPHPGTTELGRDMPTDTTRRCFSCHSTRPSAAGFDRLEPATMMPDVACEACHGPGAEHVADARRGAAGRALEMPLGPGRAGAAVQMRACGFCHRDPDMMPAGEIRPDNPAIVRFQPVGLMQSACYRRSEGALGCSACHDPHARTSHDTAAYEAACLKCHEGPAATACPVDPSTGCVGCHMPRRPSNAGMLMTDHWIRVPAADARPSP